MKENKKILKVLSELSTKEPEKLAVISLRKDLRNKLFAKYGNAKGVEKAIDDLYDEFKKG